MHILMEAVYYFTRDSKWCASNRGCVLIKDIWYYQGVRDIGVNYFLKQRMAKKNQNQTFLGSFLAALMVVLVANSSKKTPSVH